MPLTDEQKALVAKKAQDAVNYVVNAHSSKLDAVDGWQLATSQELGFLSDMYKTSEYRAIMAPIKVAEREGFVQALVAYLCLPEEVPKLACLELLIECANEVGVGGHGIVFRALSANDNQGAHAVIYGVSPYWRGNEVIEPRAAELMVRILCNHNRHSASQPGGKAMLATHGQGLIDVTLWCYRLLVDHAGALGWDEHSIIFDALSANDHQGMNMVMVSLCCTSAVTQDAAVRFLIHILMNHIEEESRTQAGIYGAMVASNSRGLNCLVDLIVKNDASRRDGVSDAVDVLLQLSWLSAQCMAVSGALALNNGAGIRALVSFIQPDFSPGRAQDAVCLLANLACYSGTTVDLPKPVIYALVHAVSVTYDWYGWHASMLVAADMSWSRIAIDQLRDENTDCAADHWVNDPDFEISRAIVCLALLLGYADTRQGVVLKHDRESEEKFFLEFSFQHPLEGVIRVALPSVIESLTESEPFLVYCSIRLLIGLYLSQVIGSGMIAEEQKRDQLGACITAQAQAVEECAAYIRTEVEYPALQFAMFALLGLAGQHASPANCLGPIKVGRVTLFGGADKQATIAPIPLQFRQPAETVLCIAHRTHRRQSVGVASESQQPRHKQLPCLPVELWYHVLAKVLVLSLAEVFPCDAVYSCDSAHPPGP